MEIVEHVAGAECLLDIHVVLSTIEDVAPHGDDVGKTHVHRSRAKTVAYGYQEIYHRVGFTNDGRGV